MVNRFVNFTAHKLFRSPICSCCLPCWSKIDAHGEEMSPSRAWFPFSFRFFRIVPNLHIWCLSVKVTDRPNNGLLGENIFDFVRREFSISCWFGLVCLTFLPNPRGAKDESNMPYGHIFFVYPNTRSSRHRSQHTQTHTYTYQHVAMRDRSFPQSKRSLSLLVVQGEGDGDAFVQVGKLFSSEIDDRAEPGPLDWELQLSGPRWSFVLALLGLGRLVLCYKRASWPPAINRHNCHFKSIYYRRYLYWHGWGQMCPGAM